MAFRNVQVSELATPQVLKRLSYLLELSDELKTLVDNGKAKAAVL